MTKVGMTDAELLMTPIQDMEHLQLWIEKFIGIPGGLPDCQVTEYANSTPAAFVYEVYRAIMDGNALHIMSLSGRDSGKTVALSIIDLLAMLHDQRSAIHIGMIRAQAQRAREYLERYIMNNPLLKASVIKQNTRELRLMIAGQEVLIELISLDPKQVQGAHYGLVSFDEISSSNDPVKLKAYKDASGIPGTTNKGKKAVIVKITSRQSGASIAEQEIKNSAKSGIKVVRWTTIDCMKRCPDERSGVEKLPLWINTIKGLKFTEKEFQAVPQIERDGFELSNDTRVNCYKCPLAVFCKGKSKNQTSNSALLREVEDVIFKVSSAPHEWALSQIMSLQGSSETIVYNEFNPSVHVPGWNAMWTRLTGEVPTTAITRAMFIERCKRMSLTFVAGIDWGGGTSPSTCVVLAIDGRENIYVLEAIGKVRMDDPDFVEYVRANVHPTYDVQIYAPDSENFSGISLLKKAGLPAVEIDKGPGSVRAGINTVKRFLKVPGTNNESRLLFAPDLPEKFGSAPGLFEEFSLYERETDVAGNILSDKNPRKGHDHGLDALRYGIHYYFGKATGQVVYTGQEEINLSPNPSMLEIARAQGVQFNDNLGDTELYDSNTGTTTKKPTDGDPNKGGGGGFQFSW